MVSMFFDNEFMMKRIVIGLTFGLCLFAAAGTAFPRVRKPQTPAQKEFSLIEQQIGKFRGYRRHSEVNSQSLCDTACIPENDRCPTRLALKRITALAIHLIQMPNAPDLSQEQAELYELAAELKKVKAARQRGWTKDPSGRFRNIGNLALW